MFPQIFGKYVLERPLAVGGMANVFLATLRGAGGFEKRLVVKQIRAELATDDAFVRRFVDEAKTTVELSHPNIVPVYELGVEQGIYYLAMELCDGVTLAELLQKDGHLAPEEAAYVGIEICRALDYAHRKAGVIHRDVTPRNVVIDEEGAVRLIDFGIAAPAYDGAREVFGSPGHMPPEQLRGEDVGPPADVFAVGTLLYEAWTGRPPFRRRTAEESQAALSEPVPPPSAFDAALAPLDALLASALALDPAERPRSAEDLSRPLRRFISDRDLGDLTRKVGERVRIVRTARLSDPGPTLAERAAVVTAVASETRTFATRSPEPIARDIPAASVKAPRRDPAPQVATRRMSDAPSTGRRASVRPARGRPVRGIAGMALGVLVVAAAAGAAWRYGDARPPAPAETVDRSESSHAVTATAATHPAQATEPRSGESVEPSAAPVASTGAREASASPKTRGPAAPNAGGTTAATRAAPVAVDSAAAPASEAPLAHVRVLANPPANVEIDGKPRGQAPILDIALPAGTHFVRLDCAALGEAVAQNVPIAAGESVTISGDFTGSHGRILVRRAGAGP